MIEPNPTILTREIGPYTETVAISGSKIEVTYHPPLPADLKEKIAAYWKAQIECVTKNAMLGGWPEGYQPGEGMPGTLTYDKARRTLVRDGVPLGIAIEDTPLV